MRGLGSHAQDSITSLVDQNEQFPEHIQDTQDAIEPFIDLVEDLDSGGDDSNFDPYSKDCFANFAQLLEPIPI